MQFTRRAALAGAAAAAAGTFSPLSVLKGHAQAPAAAPTGVFRYKFGDGEIIQVLDGVRTFPIPDGFVTNATKEQTAVALEGIYMPKGQITNSFSPVVVKLGGKIIAIDTGNGLAAFDASKGAVGNCQANMIASGIDPKSVDIVIISHFHGDHINGLKNADGAPAYPKAEIMVPATEWAFFTNEANMDKASATNKGNFANVKKVFDGLKVTQFEAGKEVASGIIAIASPGHTPGHTSFVLSSGAKRVMVQGDIALFPGVFMRNPDLKVVFDNDGDAAVATRRKIYDMASVEKLPIIGYHFPFPSAGYVEKDGTGFRLVQAQAGI